MGCIPKISLSAYSPQKPRPESYRPRRSTQRLCSVRVQRLRLVGIRIWRRFLGLTGEVPSVGEGKIYLFECIRAEMKKGSPEGYNAETASPEAAQEPQTGEPNERYSLYRIRCSQEKRQLLRERLWCKRALVKVGWAFADPRQSPAQLFTEDERERLLRTSARRRGSGWRNTITRRRNRLLPDRPKSRRAYPAVTTDNRNAEV